MIDLAAGNVRARQPAILSTALLAAVLAAGQAALPDGQCRAEDTGDGASPGISTRTIDGEVDLLVLSDNYEGKPGIGTSWGYACLVRSAYWTILFDTGGDADVFRRNVSALKVDLGRIDAVVISHDHGDHMAGLGEVLKATPGVSVYMLSSFRDEQVEPAVKQGARVVTADSPAEVRPGAITTGEMPAGRGAGEQALVISLDRGLVVLTGCAHPGVVEMVARARALTGKDVLLVMGGFHLKGKSDSELRAVIANLKEMGVRYAAPSHCSGDRTRELFREAFGERYLKMGAGSAVSTKDLS